MLETSTGKNVRIYQHFLIFHIVLCNLISITIPKEVLEENILENPALRPVPIHPALLCFLQVAISTSFLWILPLFMKIQKLNIFFFIFPFLEKMTTICYFVPCFLHLLIYLNKLSISGHIELPCSIFFELYNILLYECVVVTMNGLLDSFPFFWLL